MKMIDGYSKTNPTLAGSRHFINLPMTLLKMFARNSGWLEYDSIRNEAEQELHVQNSNPFESELNATLTAYERSKLIERQGRLYRWTGEES